MNLETARTALSLVEAGEDFAWATIIDSRGSAPRHVAASMLVTADGGTVSTVGGGPLEGAVIRESLAALEAGTTRLMPFDSVRLGMACGGGGLVLIEHIDAGEPSTLELHRALVDLYAGARKGWLVAVIRETEGAPAEVDKCLVDANGSVYGRLPLRLESLQGLARTNGATALTAPDAGARIYVQAMGMQSAAYVFGAGHCGLRLVPVLASLGFFTTIIDDRAEFACRERFPSADDIVVPESFDQVMPSLPIGPDSYIVIVTRGHAFDEAVLRQAISTPAAYVGMMGSKRKVAEIFGNLEGEGVSPETLARVYAPIGLAIGAETPEELAISIAAQMVQVRAAAAKAASSHPGPSPTDRG